MASERVSDFLANFTGGGARPNLYRVEMTFPPALGLGGDAATKLGFTCKAASIPASTLGVAPVPFMGRTVKLAGDKEWDDWSITVINDTDFVVRDAFEVWIDRINGHESNVAIAGLSNPRNYFAEATVYQMGREGEDLKKYRITGMWPNNLGEITLGYDQNDQVEEYTVSFAINEWKTDKTT